MCVSNPKGLKAELVAANVLGSRSNRMKSLNLPKKLRWLSNLDEDSYKSALIRCISSKHRRISKQFPLSISKENLLTIDNRGSHSRQSLIKKKLSSMLLPASTLSDQTNRTVDCKRQHLPTKVFRNMNGTESQHCLKKQNDESLRNYPPLPPRDKKMVEKRKRKVVNQTSMTIKPLTIQRVESHQTEGYMKRMESHRGTTSNLIKSRSEKVNGQKEKNRTPLAWNRNRGGNRDGNMKENKENKVNLVDWDIKPWVDKYYDEEDQ